MTRYRLLALLLTCFALPLALTACGGDDDDGGGGDDEAEITEVIETASTSTDPADCARLQTENSLEQTEFTGEDETALESCEEDAPDGSTNPDSVEVAEISVDGESATADATFSGGSSDGSTYSLALVKEDDQWKIDEITDVPVLNVEAFQTGLSEQLSADPDLPPEIGACFVQQFSVVTEDQLKELVLSGDEDALLAIIQPCLG